jgi:hypothetical protein
MVKDAQLGAIGEDIFFFGISSSNIKKLELK